MLRLLNVHSAADILRSGTSTIILLVLVIHCIIVPQLAQWFLYQRYTTCISTSVVSKYYSEPTLVTSTPPHTCLCHINFCDLDILHNGFETAAAATSQSDTALCVLTGGIPVGCLSSKECTAKPVSVLPCFGSDSSVCLMLDNAHQPTEPGRFYFTLILLVIDLAIVCCMYLLAQMSLNSVSRALLSIVDHFLTQNCKHDQRYGGFSTKSLGRIDHNYTNMILRFVKQRCPLSADTPDKRANEVLSYLDLHLENIAANLLTRRSLLYREALLKYAPHDIVKELDASMAVTDMVFDLAVGPITYDNPSLTSHAHQAYAVIMFVDLKDFTRMSEHLSMSDLLHILESFFSIVCRNVRHFSGTIGTYLGDGCMMIWPIKHRRHRKSVHIMPTDSMSVLNAYTDNMVRSSESDLSYDNPSVNSGANMSISHFWNDFSPDSIREAVNNACQCSLAILRELRLTADAKLSSLDARFGINAGQCILGVFGCPERLTYTAIGDTVNTASRIEAATRLFDSKILMPELCMGYIGSSLKARFMGEVNAKGKTDTIRLYEVMEANDRYCRLIDATEKIERLYDEGKLLVCIKESAEALTEFPGDGVISAFMTKALRDVQTPTVSTIF